MKDIDAAIAVLMVRGVFSKLELDGDTPVATIGHGWEAIDFDDRRVSLFFVAAKKYRIPKDGELTGNESVIVRHHKTGKHIGLLTSTGLSLD